MPTADLSSPPISEAQVVARRQQGEEYFSIEGSFHGGPVPSPATLAAYKEIDPEIVTTLLRMAQEALDHTREMERREADAQDRQVRTFLEDVSAGRRQVRLGQVFGFTLGAMGLILGATVIMVTGTAAGATAGATIAGIPLVALVTAFLRGGSAAGNEPGVEEEKAAESSGARSQD